MKKIVVIFLISFCFSCKKDRAKSEIKFDGIEVDTMPIIDEQDERERQKLEKIDNRYYHITIHDIEEKRDTIVDFDFLESDEALNTTFNYKPFDKKYHLDSISLIAKNIEVVIVKSKFDETKSNITYDSDSLNIIKIDNHKVFGADTIPSTYISKMYLNLSGNYFEIDKDYYEDLYEPNFNLTEAYYYDKEIIAKMSNSDGYLGYTVTFFLDEELNIKRIIYIP